MERLARAGSHDSAMCQSSMVIHFEISFSSPTPGLPGDSCARGPEEVPLFRRHGVPIGRRLVLVPLAAALALLAGQPAQAQADGAAPAGWSARDCETCHDKAAGPAFSTASTPARPELRELPRERGRARQGPDGRRKGPGAVDEEAEGQPAQRHLPEVPREGQPGQLPEQHARAPQRGLHVVPQRPQPEVGQGSAEDEDRLRGLLHLPQVRARQVDAHVAPPGARRQDELLELPQPARRQPRRR